MFDDDEIVLSGAILMDVSPEGNAVENRDIIQRCLLGTWQGGRGEIYNVVVCAFDPTKWSCFSVSQALAEETKEVQPSPATSQVVFGGACGTHFASNLQS